ncbi:MAG TPA: beta-ketoacyl-[acyl-carrier-protein] synthase family protein, partial [Candidatus Methylomirabilis sp.]|nr:beta-ketoacyl-[acyl-carrier-protein] synthase family protein [Candidatus Methylomirabilis sp.]
VLPTHKVCPRMNRRVAVTGMGIVTAHGIGKAVNWEQTIAGASALRPITLFDVSQYKTKRAGQLVELPPPPWRRSRSSRLDRASTLLYHAFSEALLESGLSEEAWRSPPIVALGTTLGGMASGERYHASYVRRGPSLARPSALVDHLAHCQPLHLMEEFSIPGTPRVYSNACASGANAVGYGFRAVRAGQADVALCGGYDPLCEFVFAGFHSLQALTVELCRPFDRNRSGLAIGEGAGILVLEPWELAQARGARVLGEIVGYGESNDAYHMTRPDPNGSVAALAIQRALADAGIDSEAVDYVNAHGTGTPFNDAAEAAALTDVLGSRAAEVPISSTKSMIGHLLGGAGAVEGILTVLALKERWLPPNVNFETPDPECDLRIICKAEQPGRMRVALSNSFGFGGANATLAFRALGADE